MEQDRLLYKTIVIDPPWDGPVTRTFCRNSPTSVLPYHTMTGAQIAALRIPDLAAADDAMLFLWATTRSLGDAYLHLQTWGFRYRALFIWKKPGLGLGLHVRHEAEFLIWGARRGAKRSIARSCPRQIQEWPKPKRHSAKPDEVYAFIEALSEPPRIDIFARKRRPGWDVFGDELDGDLGMTALG